MPTTLVTGASAGLGAEFAAQLAGSGHDLVLVARGADRLEALAARLRAAHGVAVEVLVADLSDRAQTERVAARLRSTTAPVDLLVANAGYGLGQRFATGDLRREEDALAVMVTAVMVLTRAACEAMVPRGRGAILTVGSVAGLMPTGTYSAHKAWVRIFTASLACELHGTGVSATVVNPGFTRTEFHERAHMQVGRIPGVAWLPASRVVRDALDAVARGRVEVTPSWRYRAASLLLRALPRPVVRRLSRPL